MASEFRYEDLTCHLLQRTLRADSAIDIVLVGEQARAFEYVIESLVAGQKIAGQKFGRPKSMGYDKILLGETTWRLFKNIPLAWKTLFKYHRFSEFKTFWMIEQPLSVTKLASNDDEARFRITRLADKPHKG